VPARTLSGKRTSGSEVAGQQGRPGTSRPQLLDVAEVAEWLGVEVVFVRRLVSERRIPFVKLGKYVRFVPDDVAGWVDELRVEPTTHSARRNRPTNR
jgi:excisionase family DNA binding protein